MPSANLTGKELVVRVCGCVSGRRKRWGRGQKIHAAVECWSSREVGQRGTAWQVLAGGLGWSGRDTWSWVMWRRVGRTVVVTGNRRCGWTGCRTAEYSRILSRRVLHCTYHYFHDGWCFGIDLIKGRPRGPSWFHCTASANTIIAVGADSHTVHN